MSKPSIAVLLGSHALDHGMGHHDDHESDGEEEDGDMDEHGEAMAEDLIHAIRKGDAATVWACFKKLDELAEHAEGEDEEEGDEEHEDEAS